MWFVWLRLWSFGFKAKPSGSVHPSRVRLDRGEVSFSGRLSLMRGRRVTKLHFVVAITADRAYIDGQRTHKADVGNPRVKRSRSEREIACCRHSLRVDERKEREGVAAGG